MTENTHYHFVGIGGIGMSALAHICLDDGKKVSGSDCSRHSRLSDLQERGVAIDSDQSGSLVTPKSCIVYSSAIAENHPELQHARELQCPLLHRSEMLQRVTKGRKTCVVTGTHGKTTTSALLAHILYEAGENPSYMIGGEVPSLPRHGASGAGAYFILEGDESDGSLLAYQADYGLITNIELDHVDHFASLDEILALFHAFIDKISLGHLVWCIDDPVLQKIMPKGPSYGEKGSADYRLLSYMQKAAGSYFSVQDPSGKQVDVSLPLSGKHNALNATGAIALAHTLGVPMEKIISSLATFAGVARRQELVGEAHSLSFIDDYAHHPTEIQATLTAMRKRDQERRLVAIFQPHRQSRFDACYQQFLQSFALADVVLVLDVYGVGNEEKAQHTIQEFIKEFEPLPHQEVHYVSEVEAIHALLHPHDQVVGLGAGSISLLLKELYQHTLEKGLKKKWRIGVVYGGASPEHYVSIESFQNLSPFLSKDFYQVEKFYVSPQGWWDEQGVFSEAILRRLQSCDIILPLTHGFWGEDGALQGLIESLHLCYAGSDYRATSLAMDKVATKLVCEKWGVATAPFIPIEERVWNADKEEVLGRVAEAFSFPMYVKPTHLGSSLGVVRVTNTQQLSEAIQQALVFDSHAMVEPEIVGRQIEFALYGNEELTCLPPGEILSEGKFVDYRGKYGSQALPMEPKADIPSSVAEKGLELSKKIFRVLNLSGVARIDFFLTKNCEWILNEVNPIPGFTPTSMYPLILNENHISSSYLLDRILMAARSKKRRMAGKVSDIGGEGEIR